MTNKFLYGSAWRNLLLLTAAALLVVVPQVTKAKSVEDSAFAPAEQSSAASELWKSGFTVEGSEPTYNALIGRILDEAAFRSYRDRDIYQVFPSPATLSTIKSARFRIASQTGTYAGNVSLTLEILEHQTGILRHVVSTASDGWEMSGDAWTPLPLSATDLQIAPDEFLAFHFHLSGDKGGDLDIRPEFEVEVQLPASANKDINNNEAVSRELWRSGFTVEGPANYELIKGRLAGVTADIRSNRDVANIHYVFPAPANLATLQSAKFYILNRTGSYEGNATLTLEVYDDAGTLLRTISATVGDLEAMPTESWMPITLSSTVTDLEIANGEFLAANVELDNGPAGDLDLRLLFEVEVTSSEAVSTEQPRIYLPLIVK